MSRMCLGFLAAIVWGCNEIPDRTSPEGAFARLAACVDEACTACLFAELDRDSRWSAHTIWRTLSETKEIVFTTYPEDRRKAALGIWYDRAGTRDVVGFFEVFCRERHCLERLARGFGAVVQVISKGPSNALVKTTRGASYPMARADGQWGYALYRDELQKDKIRALDRLTQVRKNAAEFETLRLAGTGAKTQSPAHQGPKEERRDEPRP